MKKTLRYLSLLLAAILVIAVFVTTASAAVDDGTGEATPDSPYPADGDYDGYDGYGDWDSSSGSGDAGSVADSNTLLDPDLIGDVDTTPNKWTDISIDPNSIKDGSSDLSFASIKTDDRIDPSDNGQWILWLGWTLIVLSVLGILYFILSTRNARMVAERERRHSGSNRTETARSASPRSSSRTAQRQSASHRESRASGHTADTRKASRRASKEDTAEIYIPRRMSK